MASQQHKVWFWRRFAATWIDLFLIYSATIFLLAVSDTIDYRLAFEPLFFSLAALYETIALAVKGKTVGKYFLGIRVSNKEGEKPGLRNAIIREALGKWGTLIVLPAVLGRLLVGRAWVSTVYDLLAVAIVLAVMALYWLIAKRTWYDQLAGTTTTRTPSTERLSRAAVFVLIGAAIICAGTRYVEYTYKNYLPCRLSIYRSMRSIEPYEEFLNRGQANPVDYILSLFERYDIVVLCERLHPEATQWDFIYELVSDPRFVERVGNVFTEYGSVGGMQDMLDRFMATDSLDKTEVEKRVIEILRNFPVWPVWINTNFYSYLKRLYNLNQSLPSEKRVRHFFTDSPVDWSALTTPEEYQEYGSTFGDRDKKMAQNIIDRMKLLENLESERPKALVIMNYRHAFDLTGGSPEAKHFNTYEYLKDYFADRAANVLLNTRILITAPVAGGLWDAAFTATGNSPAGFDFDNSPFGEDPFDLFPFFPAVKGRLNYSDVFTGYAFVNPVAEQYLQVGIPGFFKDFEQEALRRAALLNEQHVKLIEKLISMDKDGLFPYTKDNPYNLVEIFILVLFSIGWLIGMLAVVVSWKNNNKSVADTRSLGI